MIMFKMFYCNLEFGYALDTNSSYNFVLACFCSGYMSLEYATFANLIQSLMFIALGFFYLKLLVEGKICLIPPHKWKKITLLNGYMQL
jgi:hypothetical protein